MKLIFKALGSIIGAIILILLGYVGFMIITDYKPAKEEIVQIENNQKKKIELNKEYTVTSFNVGYAGMDKNVDFFMDGGKMSRAINKNAVLENLNGIENIMKDLNSDFYYIQELDKKSTRSYEVNEYESMKNKFTNYSTSFAKNFDVPWVPLPFIHPHGQVLSGIMTMSKYNLNSGIRYDLPGKEEFFRQLGDLDRCMLVNRVKLSNNKELLLINVHLSAYDKGGKVRKVQLGFIENFVQNEYKKGNYIILGGDWNHELPGTDSSKFKTTETHPNWLKRIPDDFAKNRFKIYSDKNVPSNRTVEKPYTEGENLRSIIDGFMVSDNVEVKKIHGSEYNFRYSDHNPTTLTFILK